MDFDRAVAFVEREGDDIERARLRYLLHQELPSPTIASALFSGQRPDGGWAPFWSLNYSSVDATCFRLAQAEQLGLLYAPAVPLATQFFQRRQADDGSWEEDAFVQEAAPPWAVPGDPAARLYLTANCGYWMARLDTDGSAVARAAGVLQDQLDEEGALPTFPHAQWLAAGCLYASNHQSPSESIMSHLAESMEDTLPASNLGWLLVTLLGVGVPPHHRLISRAVALLEQSQHPDGQWISEDGHSRDVHATLESLRALQLASCG